MLHLSGITPALGTKCRDLILNCLKEAKEMNMTVSFDGNFRSTLWTWERPEISVHFVFHVNVAFQDRACAIWKNEEDHSAGM